MSLYIKKLLSFLSSKPDCKRARKKLTKQYWSRIKNRIRSKNEQCDNGWIWVDNNAVAQRDGVYVFECAGDNHNIWEVYELKAGDSLHKPFVDENIHGDGWWPIVYPFSYYYLPALNSDGIWKTLDKQPCVGDDLKDYRLNGSIVVAIEDKGRITYYDLYNAHEYVDYRWFKIKTENTLFQKCFWKESDAKIVAYYSFGNSTYGDYANEDIEEIRDTLATSEHSEFIDDISRETISINPVNQDKHQISTKSLAILLKVDFNEEDAYHCYEWPSLCVCFTDVSGKQYGFELSQSKPVEKYGIRMYDNRAEGEYQTFEIVEFEKIQELSVLLFNWESYMRGKVPNYNLDWMSLEILTDKERIIVPLASSKSIDNESLWYGFSIMKEKDFTFRFIRKDSIISLKNALEEINGFSEIY